MADLEKRGKGEGAADLVLDEQEDKHAHKNAKHHGK